MVSLDQAETPAAKAKTLVAKVNFMLMVLKSVIVVERLKVKKSD